MKILYGILNYNRPANIVNKIINKIGKGDFLICTNQEGMFNGNHYKVIGVGNNVASSKNKILTYAKDNEYTHCFIIEDDVKIIDNSVFVKYVQLMETYKSPCVMYGYDRANKVFGKFNNPLMIVDVAVNEQLYVNRYPCSSMMGFKITNDMVMFDDRLNMIENDWYVMELKAKGKWTFCGFNIDLPESYKYFMREDVATVRQKSKEMHDNDYKTLNITSMSLDLGADEFLNHIRACLNEQKKKG